MNEVNKISSLTNEEFISLKATLTVIYNDRFNCEKCLSEFDGMRDKDERTEKSRALKACYTKLEQPRHKIEGINYYKCPGNFFDSSAVYLISIYHRFSKGFSVYDGPLSEQPNKVIEAFNVIEGYEARRKLEEQKKEARKLKSGKR